MKNFLYSLILPLTSFSFVLFTLLIALGNFLYFYSEINIHLQEIVFFNILWVGLYMYVYASSLSKQN